MKKAALAHVVDPSAPRAEDAGARGDEPEVGRWYWVKPYNGEDVESDAGEIDDDAPDVEIDDDDDFDIEGPAETDSDEDDEDDDRWLGCVTHIGTNYIALTSADKGGTSRIHYDKFWRLCTYEPNADAHIHKQIVAHQGRTMELMKEVRALTARLSISPRSALPQASETAALALRTEQPINDYKKDLILAQEKTLPGLFEQIKNSNELCARWMKAQIIPLQAEAQGLGSAMGAIKDRIFSVELYAGLIEQVAQIRKGAPADMGDPLHLYQRRAYMDEECLAEYQTGGMEFKDIRAFDRWMAKSRNFERLLPFPRCILAFRVRRERKDREISLSNFIQVMEAEQLDKFTFLYMRNGEQLYRLRTGIEFGEKLFPDLDAQPIPTGKVWVYSFGGPPDRDDAKFITDEQYQGMLEEEAQHEAMLKKAPEKDRWRLRNHPQSPNYTPFTKDNVYYDDIAKIVANRIAAHNRLVLVLQGLLDRSEIFHPHPPWSLWQAEGFRQALALVYDSDRVLVAGDKPDFEAYRERLNASLKDGCVTVGQEEVWERAEAKKENDRIGYRARERGGSYERYRPYGNPGPGGVARVEHYAKRANTCTFRWEKERQRGVSNKGDFLPATITIGAWHLLNASAYKPGDFKQFFADPRTRAEYLKWAPLLLEAEEYQAGNRKVKDIPAPLPPRVSSWEGRQRYAQKKQLKALLGKAVRLTRDVEMKNGDVYKKGTLWRVTGGAGRRIGVRGITADGVYEKNEGDWRGISNLEFRDVVVDATVPTPIKDKEDE